MKIIFFGLGSIGKRHARIMQRHSGYELYAFRSQGKGVSNELGIPEIYSWDEVKKLGADVAFITNPTSEHISVALRCAALGMHLFIEKPLSSDQSRLDELEALLAKNNLTSYVAYCLRFHPVIKKIQELIAGKQIYHVRITCSSYLPSWRAGVDHLKTYSSSAKLGGGVILDLSHEVDYVNYLFGKISMITGKFGRTSKVTVDVEDYADILMKVGDQLPVNLHLNFLSLINERMIKIDFEGGYLIGDLMKNQVRLFNNGALETFDFDVERDQYLNDQIEYFFSNLGNPAIMNNVHEARNVLKSILELKNAKQT